MIHVQRAAAIALLAVLAGAGLAAQEPPPDVSERYRIEASDVLAVKYRYSPEYDHTVMVQPDGFISLPIVGELRVGGLTVAEALAAIRTQASRRLREPEITLELKEFQRPRFFVGGEVGSPGEFALRGRIGVMQAIAMAGGFKQSAKHSQVVHLRQVDDRHAVRTIVNAKQLAKNPETADIELQPCDLLFVPQNRISKVMTSVVPLAGPLASFGLLLNPFVD